MPMLPRPLVSDFRSHDFGERKVGGRAIHPVVTDEVECKDLYMLAMARWFPIPNARWFWSPDAGMLPDAEGNTGTWILCLEGNFEYSETLFACGQPIDVKIRFPGWEPYWKAKNPFIPNMPILTHEDLDRFMRLNIPLYHEGDTPGERSKNQSAAQGKEAAEIAYEVDRSSSDELKYAMRNSPLIQSAKALGSKFDPERKKQIDAWIEYAKQSREYKLKNMYKEAS